MTSERVTLQAGERTAFGKKLRALRRAGLTPIHVYGPGGEPLALQAQSDNLRTALSEAGHTTPVTIHIEGAKTTEVTLVREVKHHPVTGTVLHADFMRVDADRPVEVGVPVVLQGEAPGIRGGAGFVTQSVYEVVVRAKPFEVPSEIVADVSSLVDFDAVLRVSDLSFPGDTEPVTDASTPVAWIQPPRVAAEEEVAPEEEFELEEGEEAAEEAPAEETSGAEEERG